MFNIRQPAKSFGNHPSQGRQDVLLIDSLLSSTWTAALSGRGEKVTPHRLNALADAIRIVDTALRGANILECAHRVVRHCIFAVILPRAIEAYGEKFDPATHLAQLTGPLIKICETVQAARGRTLFLFESVIPIILRSWDQNSEPALHLRQFIKPLAAICRVINQTGGTVDQSLPQLLTEATVAAGPKTLGKLAKALQQVYEIVAASTYESNLFGTMYQLFPTIKNAVLSNALSELTIVIPELVRHTALKARVHNPGQNLYDVILPTLDARERAIARTLITDAQTRGIFGASAIIAAGLASPSRAPQRIEQLRTIFPALLEIYEEAPHLAVATAHACGRLFTRDLSIDAQRRLPLLIKAIQGGALPLHFLMRAKESSSPSSFLQELPIARHCCVIMPEGREQAFIGERVYKPDVQNTLLNPSNPLKPLLLEAYERTINIAQSFGEFQIPAQPWFRLGTSDDSSILTIIAKEIARRTETIGSPAFPGTFTYIRGLRSKAETGSTLQLLIGRRFHVMYNPRVSNVGLIVFNDHFEQQPPYLRTAYQFDGDNFSVLIEKIRGGRLRDLPDLRTTLGALQSLTYIDPQNSPMVPTSAYIEAMLRFGKQWGNFQAAYAEEMKKLARIRPTARADICLYNWARDFMKAGSENIFGPSHIYWGAPYVPDATHYLDNTGQIGKFNQARGSLTLEGTRITFDGSAADIDIFSQLIESMPADFYPTIVNRAYAGIRLIEENKL
jgi:hypothetical protein